MKKSIRNGFSFWKALKANFVSALQTYLSLIKFYKFVNIKVYKKLDFYLVLDLY